MVRRLLCVAVGMAVGLALIAAPVTAKSAATTKIWFKLDDHTVPAGSALTGEVQVWTHMGDPWLPFAGALLTVSVDGVDVGAITTGPDGLASVTYVPTEVGDHTMKLSFAGDAGHKRAQRAQGFQVTEALPVPAPTEGVPDAPSNLFAETPFPGFVYLQWTIPADNGSPITGYRIYRGTTSGQLAFLKQTGNPLPGLFSTDDLTAVSGTTYFYVVTALNVVGESAWSNEVAITAL